MNRTLKYALIGAGVVAVGYVAWSYYKKQQQQAATTTNVTTNVQAPTGNGIADIVNAAGNTLDNLQRIWG